MIFMSEFVSHRCCAAAWEKKMRDTVGVDDTYRRKGAAASAAVRNLFHLDFSETKFALL